MSPEVQIRVRRALVALAAHAEAPPSDIRHAAVAVLLRGAELDDLEVLLMRRAEREGDRWSGQIGLPGGHEEEEDEDLLATARRESREEVGIDPGGPDAQHFGAMPSIQARARGARLPLFITPHVFHRPEPEEPTLGPEADEAFWLPLGRARAGDLDEPFRYEHEGVIHKLPSWNFEGRTIWGMTHGILSRFAAALESDGIAQ